MRLGDVVEKENHKSCFLAHAFMMIDEANKNIWQIGYYNPDTDKMTDVILEKDSIKISPELDIFKKPEGKVLELDASKVKVGTTKAIETAEQTMEKEYPKTTPIKMFFIIQNLKEIGTVFNITFLTQDLKTVNVKINSENGEIVSHNLNSLIEMGKGMQWK